MLNWRVRAHQRRRARRRYLAIVHEQWRAAGAPRAHSRPSQLTVTLLWLVVPGVLAAAAGVLLWLNEGPGEAAPGMGLPLPPGLLLVPLLVLWLLRTLLRR